MTTIYEALIALVFGGIGAGAVSLYFFKKQVRWSACRDAGLLALEVVDAVQSQMNWKNSPDETPIAMVKQPVDIAKARRALNELSLSCKDPAIVTKYMDALGVRAHSSDPKSLTGDEIVSFRNAVRQELGYGKPLIFERSRAFIAELPGTK